MSLYALTMSLALAVPQAPDAGPAHATSRREVAREIRHIPIHAWVAPSAPPVEPPLGSFLDTESMGEPMFLLGAFADDRRVMDPEHAADLVRRVVDLDWDGNNEIWVSGMMLRVAGSPDEVQMAESAVHALTRAFVRNIRIEAELYRISDRGAFPAVATSDQLARLAAERNLLRVWRGTALCAAGNLVSLGKDRHTSYVHDVNVEVAQSAKIGDTETSTLFEGVRVSVEPHALAGTTDVVLHAQFAFGEQRRPLETRSAGTDEIPDVDVPALDCTSGSMSGRIPSGSALLLSVQGHEAGGANMLLALRASTDQPGGGEVRDVSVIPITALVSEALRWRVYAAPEDLPENKCSLLMTRDAQEIAFGPSERDDLQDLMQRALGIDDSETEWLEIERGHAVVRGSAAVREAAVRVVSGLQDQLLDTFQVDMTTTLDGAHFGDGVFPRSAAPTSSANDHLHRVTFPALVGRPHAIVRGHETTVIRENDVEIAQKAQITDPVIEQVFSGVVVSTLVYPQQASLGVEADIELRQVPPAQRRSPQIKDGGALYLPTTNRARFTHGGPIAPGQPLDLGDGPTVNVGEKSYRTRQALRVTRP